MEIADEPSERNQGLSAWEPEGSVQMPSASLVLPNTEGCRWEAKRNLRCLREGAPVARSREEKNEKKSFLSLQLVIFSYLYVLGCGVIFLALFLSYPLMSSLCS